MVSDPWSRQLDGRLIYQHLSIFEPELRYMHFQRLGRLAREAVLSIDFLYDLAKSGPRERAVAFLLERLHASGNRTSLTAVVDSYRQATAVGPLVINAGDRDCNQEHLSRLLEELRRQDIDHIVTLSVGAMIKSNSKVVPLGEGVTDEGDIFGLVSVPAIPDSPSELLFIGARTLMAQWFQLESGVLELPLVQTQRGPALAEQFGQDVVAHLRLGTGNSERRPSTEAPETPFCRDLALAWRPSANRAEHTIGAAVNHCTRLSDIRKLVAQNA